MHKIMYLLGFVFVLGLVEVFFENELTQLVSTVRTQTLKLQQQIFDPQNRREVGMDKKKRLKIKVRSPAKKADQGATLARTLPANALGDLTKLGQHAGKGVTVGPLRFKPVELEACPAKCTLFDVRQRG